MYKTAIIGAGVVGAMAARRLSSYDMDLVILEKEEDVLNHFRWLCDHEKEIKTKLEIKMETYKIKSYSAGDALKKLW